MDTFFVGFWAAMLVKSSPHCRYGIATSTLYQLCKNLDGFPSVIFVDPYVSVVVGTPNLVGFVGRRYTFVRRYLVLLLGR